MRDWGWWKGREMNSVPPVQVEVVQSPRAYHDFVELPWQVPLQRPIVRPMREFQRHLFDHGRFRGKFSVAALIDNALLGKENPFYEHGELELFLARDASGKPIARLAAIHNRLHNDYHHDSVGFFGFYECVDGSALGRAATSVLLDQASEWLRQRNLTAIRGPFNPSINDDCGVWLPGTNDDYPSFMMPSNAAYYADHLQAAGMQVVKTMRVYRVDIDHFTEHEWERWGKMIERLERSSGITMRGANFKDLDSEVKTFLGIYNVALSNNWGYSPMSFKELRSMAELFQSLVDPNLIRAAEVVDNGQRKVVGATITIPDLNEILRDTGGRLLHPKLFWKILRMKMGASTKRIRIVFLGILPEYRHTPVSVAMLFDSIRQAKQFGAKEVEASWILEDNYPMAKPLEDHGFKITDNYVIYERPIV